MSEVNQNLAQVSIQYQPILGKDKKELTVKDLVSVFQKSGLERWGKQLNLAFSKNVWVSEKKVKESLKEASPKTIVRINDVYNSTIGEGKINQFEKIFEDVIKLENQQAAETFFKNSLEREPVQLAQIAAHAEVLTSTEYDEFKRGEKSAYGLVLSKIKTKEKMITTFIYEKIKAGEYKLEDSAVTLPKGAETSKLFLENALYEYLNSNLPNNRSAFALLLREDNIINDQELIDLLRDIDNKDHRNGPEKHKRALVAHLMKRIEKGSFIWHENNIQKSKHLEFSDEVHKAIAKHVEEFAKGALDNDREFLYKVLKVENLIWEGGLKTLEGALESENGEDWATVKTKPSGIIYQRAIEIIEKTLTRLIIEGKVDIKDIKESLFPKIDAQEVSSLKPPEDIHKQEKFDSKNGAWGRVETTSKTDEHQLNGPRNDDNVSLTQFAEGGSIIIETDGAGSGGEGSAVLSHELNSRLNKEFSLHYGKLRLLAKAIATETDPERKKELREQLERDVREIGDKAFKQSRDIAIKGEFMNGATTLSLVINVPVSEGKTLSFGLQNHDSLSVNWNPETGKFESESAQHAGSQNQVHVGDVESISKSNFFVNEFEGPRIAIALSDGVLDNLPGEENELATKLELLNDIVLNPIFDTEVKGHSLSHILTTTEVKGLGTKIRLVPKEITPQIVRNRILNYTFWATKALRDRQAAFDPYEQARLRPNTEVHHKFEFKKGDKIDEGLYKALPKEFQNKVETQGYIVKEDISIKTLILPKSRYEEFPSSFREIAPQVTYTKDTVPKHALDKLEEEYKKRDLEYKNEDLVIIVDDTIMSDHMGKDAKKKQLHDARGKDPSAFSAKTDGVSVIAVKVG